MSFHRKDEGRLDPDRPLSTACSKTSTTAPMPHGAGEGGAPLGALTPATARAGVA
jgi:hypothetical protein